MKASPPWAANLARTLAFADHVLVDGDPQHPSPASACPRTVPEPPFQQQRPRQIRQRHPPGPRQWHPSPPSLVRRSFSEGGALRPPPSDLWTPPPPPWQIGGHPPFPSGNLQPVAGTRPQGIDCVILDSIPVFAADDTTRASWHPLRRQRATPLPAPTPPDALDTFERQAKVLGLVFNRANGKAKSYKLYKYASYYQNSKT